MNEFDLMNGAKDLRRIAIQKMSTYQNCVYVIDHYSDEYIADSCKETLLDYADFLINDFKDEEDWMYLAVAVKLDLVDYTDSDMDTVISLNISKFEILEDIINSSEYYHYELHTYNWDKENQVEFIVSLLNIYFSDESQRVKAIWDEIPWGMMGNNIINIFDESLLERMDNTFNVETYSEETLRLLLDLM